ncbi:MAG: hypothetical protein U0931_05210 [Vulcanimicrobiota bacterium]
MMKFELPNVMPAPGNPFAAPTNEPGAARLADIGTSVEIPVSIRPTREAEAPAEENRRPEESQPIATTMAQLIESMQQAEGLFKQAFQLALTTRNRETELLQRAEEAERESRHQERQAAEWRERYQALDAKIPKWVRKLFRAS